MIGFRASPRAAAVLEALPARQSEVEPRRQLRDMSVTAESRIAHASPTGALNHATADCEARAMFIAQLIIYFSEAISDMLHSC